MGRIFGVAGNPIFHSRSPLMFNTAFRELAMDSIYIRCAASSAGELITMARQIGMDGFNVTAPFKADIISYLDEVEGEAKRIGSVNTVVRKDGRFIGHNTDIAGVLGAVKTGGIDPSDHKAVVLGAGGAGRSAALALISSGADVTIVNRTFSKAEEAARALGCKALSFDRVDEALEGACLLVSAISVSERLVKPHLLSKKPVVLDANYGLPTALVRDALSVGCTVIDGKEWLLAQALPAFSLFTGHTAPVQIMRKVLWKERRDGRRNIALIGFMGTGKSVVAEEIAALADMAVVDIDRQIEEKEGSSIGDIFSQKGETAFRHMEQLEIDRIRSAAHTVVACGGGAVLNRANVRVLRNTCLSAWLWADVETILARTGRAGTRPLLNVADPEDRVRTLLQERLFLYASNSDLVVNTEGKRPEEIAERIWNEVGNTIKS